MGVGGGGRWEGGKVGRGGGGRSSRGQQEESGHDALLEV